MDKQEILKQVEPILNRFIETVDQFLPDNQGVVVMFGVQDKDEITVNIGGNGKADFSTASKIALSATGEIHEYFGYSEEEETKL